MRSLTSSAPLLKVGPHRTSRSPPVLVSNGLGALLVGHHDNGEFPFAGKIGTGQRNCWSQAAN